MMLSFVVICLDKFLKNKPHVSADLVKLTLTLSYGFFVIALIGLIAAGFRAGIYFAHMLNAWSIAMHKLAESWHESNGIIAWFLHKADAIMQFFAAHAHCAGVQAPSPSPSPAVAPTP